MTRTCAFWLVWGALTSLTLALPAAAQTTTIINGDPDGPNSSPFATGSYTGEYQLVFDSSLFAAPVAIQQIAFASDFTSNPAPGFATYNLDAGFGTTASSARTPTPNFAANKRADFTPFFSGTMTTYQRDNQTFDLVFYLSTPFVYDPAKGNLLFDVVVRSSSGPSTTGFSDGYTTATNVFNEGRVFHPNSTNANEVASDTEGLWTRFVVTSAPEPSAFAAFGLGVFGLGVLALRARSRAA